MKSFRIYKYVSVYLAIVAFCFDKCLAVGLGHYFVGIYLLTYFRLLFFEWFAE